MRRTSPEHSDDEPPCIVDGLDHAWVPQNPGNLTALHARCGRCGLTRSTVILSVDRGAETFYSRPPRSLASTQD